MKLLIIGGTGVLSSSVVQEALKQGIDITIVNRGKKKTSIPDNVNLIKADYRNMSETQALLSGLHYDTVIDFICYTKEQIKYSINLLHSIADQYIFISSTCVYNTAIDGVKTEDSEKVLNSWSYSINKWECERLLTQMSKELNFKFTIVRPCVTYDDTRIPYGIMPPYGYHWTFIARILSGKPIIRWDKGTTKWNMMRVEDFAIGVIGLVGNKKSIGEAFNICGDESYSWNDVISSIEQSIGVNANIFDISSAEYMKFYPDKEGEIAGRSLNAIVSNNKIKSIIPNYKSNFSLLDGIDKTIKAYQTQGYQNGIDYSFDGDTDRIIRNIAHKQNLSIENLNIGFIDYLGNASKKDKQMYMQHLNRDKLFIKFRMFFSRCFSAIKRKF